MNHGIRLRRIVTAADESDAGRAAVRAGLDLANRASCTLTVLRTVPGSAVPEFVTSLGQGPRLPDSRQAAIDRLWQWLAVEVEPLDDRPQLELAITDGLPGVEIPRFAEARDADVLVLGRKQRSPRVRLLLGDTADAVARRSGVPCLFVQPGTRPIRRVLAALDGTERGLVVLRSARGFAASIGAELLTMTVERADPGEPADLADALPTGRSTHLRARVQDLLGEHQSSGGALRIRRGAIVDELLAEVTDTDSDVLAIGYHRGGPPGVIDAGSTARRLAHTAPCAVLTIPL